MAYTTLILTKEALTKAQQLIENFDRGTQISPNSVIAVLQTCCIALKAIEADETLFEWFDASHNIIQPSLLDWEDLARFFEIEGELLIRTGFEPDTSKRICDSIKAELPRMVENPCDKARFIQMVSALRQYVCMRPEVMTAALIVNKGVRNKILAVLGGAAITLVNATFGGNIGSQISGISIAIGVNFFTAAAADIINILEDKHNNE